MPSALEIAVGNVDRESKRRELLAEALKTVKDLAEFHELGVKLHHSNVAWLFAADITAKVARLVGLDDVEKSAREISDGRTNDELWSRQVRRASLQVELKKQFTDDQLEPDNLHQTQRQVVEGLNQRAGFKVNVADPDLVHALDSEIFFQDMKIEHLQRPAIRKFQELVPWLLPDDLVRMDANNAGPDDVKAAYRELIQGSDRTGNMGFYDDALKAERGEYVTTHGQSRQVEQQQADVAQTQKWDLYSAPTSGWTL